MLAPPTRPQPFLPSPLAGYSDPASAGCKQFTVGFAALEDSSSTATAEIAVNGMDPPELAFPPAEPTKGTSGQWRRSQADKIEARVVKEKKNLGFTVLFCFRATSIVPLSHFWV